jgi:large subunit ribosomal protein L17
MRHSRVINHLGRTSSHRKSMLSNMATSLILHKRITTTTAKAKALRTFVEPLITKSKEDSTHSRRVVFSYLKDKTAVAELFREVSPKVAERPGGYTRILKTGHRIGDNADMCIMELVDYNESMLGTGEAAKTKTTRRRRSAKKKEDAQAGEKTPKTAKAKVEKPEKPVAKAEESAAGEAKPEAE